MGDQKRKVFGDLGRDIEKAGVVIGESDRTQYLRGSVPIGKTSLNSEEMLSSHSRFSRQRSGHGKMRKIEMKIFAAQ